MDQPSIHESSSLTKLKRAVEEMRDPEDKAIAECMLVVIRALEVGADVDRLFQHTGYKRDFIECISVRMRKAALWLGELVDDREWWDQDPKPMFGIFRHALVAKGTSLRVPNTNGGCTYLDAETVEGLPTNQALQRVSDQARHRAISRGWRWRRKKINPS